ncbi:MAG: right-handed parallel beta-helix repeat-containing protein [Fibrobacterota bacterium]
MKLKGNFISALFLCTILLWGHSSGETLRVPSSGMRSLVSAFVKAQPGDTVLIARGIYEEKILVPPNVVVKAEERHKVKIDGGGRGTVVEMNLGSVIDGLVIQNGTIGVFSKSREATIKNCEIVKNWMTGVMTVRHAPELTDNLIAFNGGSGIVGWDTKSTTGEMLHNTIAYNEGFGLWLGGKSEITFKRNVVAYNQKYGYKWSDESAASIVTENNFWENLKKFYDYPVGNEKFMPDFRAPKSLRDFRPRQGCCAIKSRTGQDLGIRYTE